MASGGGDSASENHQEVVDTIRLRIRSQALDLLERCESRRPSLASDADGSTNNNIPISSPIKTKTTNTIITPSIHEDDEEEQEEEEKKDDSGASGSRRRLDYLESVRASFGTPPVSPGDNVSSSSNHLDAEEQDSPTTSSNYSATNGGGDEEESTQRRRRSSTSSALTQRLQQLALINRQGMMEDQRQRLRIIQSDENSHLSSKCCKSFQELELPEYLLKAVFEMGLDRPSAIQEAALPRILQGRNLIGQAQSGSGKTAAFTLGLLYHCQVNNEIKSKSSLQSAISTASSSCNNNTDINPTTTTQGLVLCPTRELAIQVVEQAMKPMAVYMKGLKIKLAISGVQQKKGTDVDAHIVVGTPGKIVDWLKKKIINPTTIKCCVMDEADTMVEEGGGFRANSLLVKKQLSKSCQYLLFSATFSPAVVEFASKIVGNNTDKILIEDDETLVVDVIKQLWIDCRTYPGGKIMFLADIYNLMTIGQSIIFVETRTEADQVHSTLSQGGYTCSVLHSGIEAEDRDTTMEDFRKGKTTVLITTNVLARGVDVDNVCLVIQCHIQVNKDGQPDYETYLHRIGRTGRFGRKGTAITLVSDELNATALRQIEKRFGSTTSAADGGVGGGGVGDGEEQQQAMIQQAEADPEALADVIEI